MNVQDTSEKKILARAPLRLGLAGGGTDVDPYCTDYGGHVLNVTINKYALAMIEMIDGPYAQFCSVDLEKELTFSLTDETIVGDDLALHLATYKFFIENFNHGIHLPVRVTSFCDAPVGSGLGSSSTIVVAMVCAFSKLLELQMDNYKIAETAFKIERLICKLQGGRQDHYSATFGGLNFIDFGPGEETRVNPLKVSETVTSELESKLLLFFMGTSRKSMKIIKEQSDAIKSGDLEKIAAMHNLKGEALLAKNALLKSDLNQLYDCLNRSWEQKKRLSSNVSNTDINLIMEAARKAGALAGKVSGAGGGGFAMFFVPLESRQRVVNALKPFGGSTSSCSFSAKGVESWVY